MSRTNVVPIRTCMGCGVTAPQVDLCRVVRDPAGGLLPDTPKRAPGRGGYLHLRQECLALFARRKGALRSLRASIDRPARAALIEQLRPQAGE